MGGMGEGGKGLVAYSLLLLWDDFEKGVPDKLHKGLQTTMFTNPESWIVNPESRISNPVPWLIVYKRLINKGRLNDWNVIGIGLWYERCKIATIIINGW